MKLEEKLPSMYAELHEKGAFSGKTWRAGFSEFRNFVQSESDILGRDDLWILDYGCGPTGGILEKLVNVISYDPYVPEYSNSERLKKNYNIFFSYDVFEHLPWDTLAGLLRSLRKKESLKKIFVGISTRPANKTFSNGLNVHLLVRSADWWEGVVTSGLWPQFEVTLAKADLIAGELIIGLERKL